MARVEMVQVQFGNGTVAAGAKRLEGTLKAPVLEQALQDLVDGAGLPESLEDQGRSDPGATSGDAVAPYLGAKDAEFL
jgi:hypothetical protein